MELQIRDLIVIPQLLHKAVRRKEIYEYFSSSKPGLQKLYYWEYSDFKSTGIMQKENAEFGTKGVL